MLEAAGCSGGFPPGGVDIVRRLVTLQAALARASTCSKVSPPMPTVRFLLPQGTREILAHVVLCDPFRERPSSTTGLGP